jgi:hypothetical protein
MELPEKEDIEDGLKPYFDLLREGNISPENLAKQVRDYTYALVEAYVRKNLEQK